MATTPFSSREPRRFNDSQRLALWLASGGRCAGCGMPLPTNWHADHSTPYSRGGATDVINGQALCPLCNMKKGTSMSPQVGQWPDGVVLRRWQSDVLRQYQRQKQRDFLLVAAPGAGKTTAALRIAHWLLVTRQIDGIAVIVPTESLRKQWADKAAKVGLQLNPDWTNGNAYETGDFHGFCATYHSVGANPDICRGVCHKRRMLVILDEVHHAGDNLTWGRAIRHAFEPAAFRLCLSGTPFRSDNTTIPYVTYAEGYCVADFSYGIKVALGEGDVLRPIMFPKYDGLMRWLGERGRREARFSDALPDDEASRRLRTALDVGGDWLRQVIAEADQQLLQIRRSPDEGGAQPDAGGLILCIDQQHARKVAALVRAVTGAEPTIAVSEDSDASDRIEAFKTGSGRWLISVRMVSEGVDIPRLYVGVYATNVITELFFRQVTGRFMRWTENVLNQVAVLYIPQEETLVSYAQRLHEEQAAALEEIEARCRDWAEERDEARSPAPFTPLGSQAVANGFIYHGEQYAPALIAEVERRCAVLGFTDPQIKLALTRALALEWPESAAPVPASTCQTAEQPAYDQRREMREAGNRKAKRFGFLVQELAGRSDYPGHQAVNSVLLARFGRPPGKLTIAELTERLALLNRWIGEALAAQREGVGETWLARWEGK